MSEVQVKPASKMGDQSSVTRQTRLGLRDCLLLAIILLIVNAILVFSHGLKRFDQSLYDKL